MKWLPMLKQSRFYFPALESPTYANLARYLQAQHWVSTQHQWLAHFGASNFEFDVGAAECLEYKHRLARLITHFCPEVMPETYGINDSNWPSVLSDIAEKYYLQNNRVVNKVDDLVWILKPALLNNGQQIKIFDQLSQIEQHFLSSNRLGGDHILQRYITHPHLLNGNKYSIRMFVVATNYAGVYLHPQGYFNVALNEYMSADFEDLRPHLTNEHLSDQDSNVVQVPTAQFDFFSSLYPQIKTLLSETMSGLHEVFPQAFVAKKQRCVAIFGVDFMVDIHHRVWLLEANHGPCFPTTDDHPLQKTLYTAFWQDFIQSFVFPIAKRQAVRNIRYSSFEKIFPVN